MARLDGRVVVVAALVAVAAAVALARVVWDVDLWRWLAVPSVPSLFFDARNVTAAVECRDAGFDPLVRNPCDPRGRTIFYPRAWLLLRHVGVDQGDTLVLGALFVAVFVVALLAVVGRLSLREGAIVAFAAASPAVLFAVERGQGDLVVFALLAGAVVLWRRGARLLAPLPVLAAAVLKLFPVFGLAAYPLSRSRRAAVAAVGAFAVFALYAFVTRDDLRTIAAVATQGQHHSFGARILLAPAAQALGLPGGLAAQAALGAAALLAAIVAVARSRSRGRLHAGPVGWRLHAFTVGALIYEGTFFTLNSFDYRLVVLLLTLPYLLAERHRVAVRATLVVVVAQLWVGGIAAYRTLADEIMSWAVAVLLAVLLLPLAAAALERGRYTK